MAADRFRLVVFGRLLTCRTCHADVDLIELPAPWIDADEYQCGECMKPVEITVPSAPWETAA